MRQLLPTPADGVDLYEAYRPDSSLLRLNMILSVDGEAQDRSGQAGGLGGEGDHDVFRVLRAHADAILVGANTVRVEGYGPHRLTRELRARRGAGPAALVVVSASLDLDFSSPLFTEAETPTIVVAPRRADPERLAAARRAGRVLEVGEERVDIPAAVTALRADCGFAGILCEGGPTLNTELLSAGLVDELCLTVAPMLNGAEALRLTEELPGPRRLRLAAALEHDGELYLRYRVGDQG